MNDTTPFLEYLQYHIDRLCGQIEILDKIPGNNNYRRVAIVTKHALIDFSRILKGRKSAQEKLYRGGPAERQTQLLADLRQELIGCGLRPPKKEKKR